MESNYFYAHLASKADSERAILESVKLPISGKSVKEISDQILAYLQTERNDGNKLYAVETLH